MSHPIRSTAADILIAAMRKIVVAVLLAVVLPAAADAQWDLEKTVDPFTDETDSVASLLSEERRLSLIYICWSDGEDIIRLRIRLRLGPLDSRYEAFESGSVRYRFDDLPAQREIWFHPDDHDDLIETFPFAQEHVDFLRSLLQHETLLLRVMSVRNGSVTDRFNLTGTAAMLEQAGCRGESSDAAYNETGSFFSATLPRRSRPSSPRRSLGAASLHPPRRGFTNSAEWP